MERVDIISAGFRIAGWINGDFHHPDLDKMRYLMDLQKLIVL
jgi:hypothetical protein